MNTSRTGRIAFQGDPGAYSNIACREAYPSMEPVPCASFEDAFSAVSQGDCELAMIPIENSLGGRVADIHHLLPESRLYITDEHFQSVQHCLIGLPGSSLESIERVLSHAQALAQCRGLIKDLGLKAVTWADTAGAAKEIAERGDPSVAAIASQLAAELNGLTVLRTRIEDKLGNTTRFVVMSRNREEPDPHTSACMTSLVFEVRSVPAALYKALGGFATNGVNITKLESYIVDASFTVAQFYVELEGHPSQLNVAHALDELAYFTTKVRFLGTYSRHAFRDQG